MTAPIDLYNHEDTTETTEKQFMPNAEAGRGYSLRLFSIKEHDTFYQATFETNDNRLYGQRFWKDSTNFASLEAIMKQWVTADIEITPKGYQKLVNVEIVGDEPTPQSTADYLNSIKPPNQQEDVPF